MKTKKYSRFEFLKAVGFTGPALMAVLSSCTQNENFNVDALVLNKDGETVDNLQTTKSSSTTSGSTTGGTTGGTTGSTTGGTTGSTTGGSSSGTTVNALFKLDLTSSSMSNLKNAGGYVIVNNAYVVGKTTKGEYVAATVVCTHEPKRQIILNSTEYFCTAHGARFNLAGQPLNTIARSSIAVYKTMVDGNTLIVY